MGKFKVGDRVRRVRNISPWAPLGYETDVLPDMEYIAKDGGRSCMHLPDWELITPAGPVRAVTRKEIVPGVYGKVNLTGHIPWGPCGTIRVGIEKGDYTPTELREAADTFIELADAMESE